MTGNTSENMTHNWEVWKRGKMSTSRLTEMLHVNENKENEKNNETILL